eukprot:3409588-Rhodomonas_salina.2
MLGDWGTLNRNQSVQCTGQITFHIPSYSGVWCNTVASSFLNQFDTGVLDQFLLLEGMGWRFLGVWWKKQAQKTDAQMLFTIQLMSDTYPMPANLKRWG